MTSFESDELDDLLRDLLSSRPVPAAPPDLARTALRRGRAAAVVPSRFRRLNWLMNAVAALWITALAAQQLHAHYSAGGFQSWFSYDQASESTTTTSTTATTATSTDHTALWLLGGGSLALLGLAGVLAQQTTGGPDEAWTTLPV